MEYKNIIDATPEEQAVEYSIRPSSLDEFIGQAQIKNNLKVFISAALARKVPLDHVLLHGPPGLGKTSMAQIIATEMSVNIKITSGPLLSKAADLASILTNLQQGDVLFIDEIHRLPIAVEEVLYSAMEDYRLDLIIGEGPAARSVSINIARFTLIGATTRIGLLSKPLRERFGIPLRMSYYQIDEIEKIIKQAAVKLNISLDEKGANEIARRSRGTPRVALRLLKRITDFAQYDNKSVINYDIAVKALNELEVDSCGFDSNDTRYLRFIADKYNGGPVGVETISTGLSEHKNCIEEYIEPYLIQQGFIQRTPRGRVLTATAIEYLQK